MEEGQEGLWPDMKLERKRLPAKEALGSHDDGNAHCQDSRYHQCVVHSVSHLILIIPPVTDGEAGVQLVAGGGDPSASCHCKVPVPHHLPLQTPRVPALCLGVF